MIYNNGASLPGKGLHFSQQMLIRDLRRHFRKYGREGEIILTDGKKFFPSADHDYIYQRHKRLILDDSLCTFGNSIVKTVKGGAGMPLGVEPSQAEMIAYPSQMDNYLAAQCRLTGGHYMDDFYHILPPNEDPQKAITEIYRQAKRNRIRLNVDKTRHISLKKPFRYCKIKYILTDSGRIVRRANKSAVPRDRRKIKALCRKLISREVTLVDIWASINGMLAYLKTYNEHTNILRLEKLFFSVFGFSCEAIRNGGNYAIHQH